MGIHHVEFFLVSYLYDWGMVSPFSHGYCSVWRSVCEMEERKSKIDSCGRSVVDEGDCRQLLVAVAKL